MMRILVVLLVLPVLFLNASAEEAARKTLQEAELSQMQSFAEESGMDLNNIIDGIFSGELPKTTEFLSCVVSKVRIPLNNTLEDALGMLAPVLMLGLLGSMMPDGKGGTNCARFMLRIVLLGGFSTCALRCVEASVNCILSSKKLTDIIAPVFGSLTTAAGLNRVTGTIAPVTAIAGNLTEQIFLKYGIPLCRVLLCATLTGGISEKVNLERFSRIIKKLVGWGAGLCVALFTGLLSMHGNVASSLDTIAVRTAKYAVDSATSVIGSGVSDVWDNYVAGIMIAKNTVGFSGLIMLFSASLQPLLQCLLSMLLLNVVSGFLDLLGDGITAQSAEQIAGVCQLALMLSCSALAIATVLLGGAISIGKGILF